MLRKAFGAVDKISQKCVTIADVLCGHSVYPPALQGALCVDRVLGKPSRKATILEKVLGTLSRKLLTVVEL